MTLARVAAAATLLLALTQATGCSPGYFVQATAGQLEIMRARRPIGRVLADPATAPDVRARLQLAGEVLRFAHRELALPDNGSYRDYAELGRPYAVWNVFAAPEFSLALRRWCFPIAGCVAYRGYFARDGAQALAARLARRGYDVHVAGAVAYSTLGFFRDPLLDSALRLPDRVLAALIIHELAHQQLYVPGDTVFNESFATLVEQEGLARWLAARGDEAGLCSLAQGIAREQEVHALLDETRTRLAAIYDSPAPDEVRRAMKAAEIEGLHRRYRELRARWTGPPVFDAWFDGRMNNATLGAIAAYDRWVGTLRVILEAEGGDLTAFYRRAARLGRLDAAGRAEVLAGITARSTLAAPAGCAVERALPLSVPAAADRG
jgi:predicted aminopeptidase